MKTPHHHRVKRAYRGVSFVFIALLGFIFIAEIVKAYHEVAYRTEEARLLEERLIYSAP